MKLVLALALLLAGGTGSPAGLKARYVRLEAPASGRMELHEIEVYAGDVNIARGNPGPKLAGSAFRQGNLGRALIDGKADPASRGFTLGLDEGLGPWVELDFGAETSVNRVVERHPAKPAYADRGARLLTLLDGERKIVFARVYDVRAGVEASFAIDGPPHGLVGRAVPTGTAGWAPLSQLLDVEALPPPPDAPRRASAFAARNSPESLAALSRAFFARVDLALPELADVRRAVEAGEQVRALNLFRDRFLENLARVAFMPEHPTPSRRYAAEADDLLAGVVVTLAVDHALAQRFVPGTFDWGFTGGGAKGALAVARERVLVGAVPRALLTAYRESGAPRYLDAYEAILDDWGLHVRADADRAAEDVRDYFVKEPLQKLNAFCEELAVTAAARPEFKAAFDGATLARALLPVLEEYPPSYWWVCRRAAFNHTYNALIAAYTSAKALRHFHAGRRLGDENRRHWQRVWTANMTRDGSMVEIGDEGHLDMHLRMGALYKHMLEDPPDWLTPDFRAEFETGYRESLRYVVRHLSPDGLGHRFEIGDQFRRIWEFTGTTCTIGNMIPRPRIDVSDVLREPEIAAVMRAVFGAARDGSKARDAARQEIETFYKGVPARAPEVVSDWMPYAGLHYLRRGWKPGDAFAHMLSQPTGCAETNGRNWNTEFRLWDFGRPLLACGPLRIDKRPQFPDYGKQTVSPGSKTSRLTVASERPIDARFHASAAFDLAETFYRGAYQDCAIDEEKGILKVKSKALEDVEARRFLIQLREDRLWCAVDLVRFPDGERHECELPYQFLAPAGANLRHFGAELNTAPGGGPNWWRSSEDTRADFLPKTFHYETRTARTSARGALTLATLIEGAEAVERAENLSGDDRAGFTARTRGGAELTLLVARGPSARVQAGPVVADAALLLLRRAADGVSGLALGVRSFTLDGATLEGGSDFEFQQRSGAAPRVVPIRRPIAPVVIGPAETVFTEAVDVTLSCDTPGVEIRYTLDGTEPTGASPRYETPIRLRESGYVRARALRPGAKIVPFAAAGTEVTAISDARFARAALLPAARVEGEPREGLDWEIVEGSWYSLFSHLHLPQALPAAARGSSARVLDVSGRRGDGPFGLRQTGWLVVPADGVYTFHAPAEYVGASCEPGYDLRLFVDGREWEPGGRRHGWGAWSLPLAKGPHRLMITFADARHRDRVVRRPGLWRGYPAPWVVWRGEAPVIDVSGPGIARTALPAAWLKR